MKFNRNELMTDLAEDVQKAIMETEKFRTLTEKELNFKTSPESWSILECLEHLNLYGDFYLVEIEKRILEANSSPTSAVFKSGLLGNYFTNSMQPKTDGSIDNKMNTFKHKNPVNSDLPITTVDRFIKQQRQMLVLLEQGKKVDLKKIKSKTTLPLVKFRLGDTFRFVIAHNNRHIVQANKVLSVIS